MVASSPRVRRNNQNQNQIESLEYYRYVYMMDRQQAINSKKSTILRLSGGLHLDTILSRIQRTTMSRMVGNGSGSGSCENNPIRKLSCVNLNLELLLEPLMELLTSTSSSSRGRSWQFLEFAHCRRIDLLLEALLEHNNSENSNSVQVESLSLTSSEPLDMATCKALSQTSKLMTKLHLNIIATPETMQVVAQGLLLTTPTPPPQVFNKNNNDGNDNNIHSPSSCQQLEELDLSLTSWEPGAMDALADALSENTTTTASLRKLNFHQCYLRDEEVARLVNSIVSSRRSHSKKNEHLQELDLRGNACQTKTLQALPALLQSSHRLACLRLTNDELTEGRVEGLTAFMQSLQQQYHASDSDYTSTPALQSLSLGEYRILDDDMEALIDSLQNNHCCLKELSILTCGMTSSGVKRFAQHLANFSSLSGLAIPGCNNVDADADADDVTATTTTQKDNQNQNHNVVLEQGLQRNMTLQVLKMENMTPRHEWCLDLNRGGRRMLVTPSVSPALYPLILERAQRRTQYYGGSGRSVDVLYSLLRGRILLEQN